MQKVKATENHPLHVYFGCCQAKEIHHEMNGFNFEKSDEARNGFYILESGDKVVVKEQRDKVMARSW